MSRFFKGAAFPILIVVVLAFFAQKVISPSSGEKTPTFNEFLHTNDQANYKSPGMHDKDNSVTYVLKTGKKKYETGYAGDYGAALTNKLNVAATEKKLDSFDVKSSKTSGWVSILTYLLPFVIFIGFWIFLMNQVQG